MTDYKGLCRELVLLDQAEPGDYADWRQAWNAAIDRARVALAEPEPEGPTDGELLEDWDLVPGARAYEEDVVDFARAVLARWGDHPGSPDSSTPQPIPVSERLPGVRDCAPWPGESDASPWCWVGSDVDGGWIWEQRSAGCLAVFPDDFTHWLPAHALLVPIGEPQP